jgi:hypothetical protein
MSQMHQRQTVLTQQMPPAIAPIDPTPILQSESPTAVILATAILISILVSSITGLVLVILVKR